MSIKPLILGVSITLGLLAITVTLRFIIYPLWIKWIQRKEELEKEVMLTNDYQDKTIEIKINGRKLIN
ncbi:hypothetical protein [Thomasclavelia cocleata]|uniref:hypothetical protein n=1 Tax=Thomasclavelia cocleata TaxID=69824 RepID=UPI00258F0E54|nr:hypothetical protein [Thomasclavelia cocleata]